MIKWVHHYVDICYFMRVLQLQLKQGSDCSIVIPTKHKVASHAADSSYFLKRYVHRGHINKKNLLLPLLFLPLIEANKNILSFSPIVDNLNSTEKQSNATVDGGAEPRPHYRFEAISRPDSIESLDVPAYKAHTFLFGSGQAKTCRCMRSENRKPNRIRWLRIVRHWLMELVTTKSFDIGLVELKTTNSTRLQYNFVNW